MKKVNEKVGGTKYHGIHSQVENGKRVGTSKYLDVKGVQVVPSLVLSF